MYRKQRAIGCDEYCFNIELEGRLDDSQVKKLILVLADGFIEESITAISQLNECDRIVEIGTTLNRTTAWSSNLVSNCHTVGLTMITRVERSKRYVLGEGVNKDDFIAQNCDRMMERVYEKTLTTFDTGITPEAVYYVDMIGGGPDVLKDIPGISMDERDRNFYYDYFVKKHKRNPTIVEIMDLNNANSEHSRHGFFGGKQVIDGIEQSQTLFDLVEGTLEVHPKGSLVAFKDNSSVVEGWQIKTLTPDSPGKPSRMSEYEAKYHLLLTAETHNFPTGVAPFPGAETGTGGRIRDVQGTGKGGFVIAGTAGYCVANLHIPGYDLPWELESSRPDNLASALEIEIEASNGASDYGNKFGEPMIQGFTRSFDLRLDDGERWGFIKPIMFTGGIGQIDDRHIIKDKELKGMKIVQVGGPAYRVGFGGGAASSMLQGENKTALDFNAVQRGNGEMEQKMNRVIRACNEMGDKTLIDVIHDQGAGGPANVLKELVEHSGGWIEIRNIIVGDPTMSVLEIYVAEYQERNGFLISPENIEEFQTICEREKVGCEVLGEVTGDMQFVVHDSNDGTTPVDLDLSEVLGDIPQKTFEDNHANRNFTPFTFPKYATVVSVLEDVSRLVSVGSKRFLTNKVDRAVTGLIAQQQCCGPLQTPLADVAVVAQSHFGLTGGATAIGEQPIKMIADPAAGARMAVGESLLNLVWARIADIEQVKCSANWMWAPKLSGEGAALRDAAEAMCKSMTEIGIAVDGGKDSFSMATKLGDEVVKSPRELVISLYGAMKDITKVITPDIKYPGESVIVYVDLANGKTRMGGTAVAQVHGQIGSEVPDMDDPALVREIFDAVQYLIDRDLILAGHDISDGGFITALLEMAFAGNCGLAVNFDKIRDDETVLERMYTEELGFFIECYKEDAERVMQLLTVSDDVNIQIVAETSKLSSLVEIKYDGELVLSDSMLRLRRVWEETSYQLERLQKNPICADEEKFHIFDRSGPKYVVPFHLQATFSEILMMTDKPKVAILRDEGSNSDREMSSAFYAAGFEPWDITMSDLLAGRIDLSQFRGLAAVGGFSYADVPESAKGWAATIQLNKKLKVMFAEFYERPNTFSLGICNGCQLFGLLGWVPWRGIVPENQPRFVHNVSGSFESRWSTVKVSKSPAIMLDGMEGLIFGIHVDHGEGRLTFPDQDMLFEIGQESLIPISYVDDNGNETQKYPFNPNGSEAGRAGMCTRDGRHLAMMPHPERAFLPWQAHYLPEDMKEEYLQRGVLPWMQMFQNAYEWCMR